MNRKPDPGHQAQRAVMRRLRWLVGLVVLAAVVALALQETRTTAPMGPDPSRLVGRWLRSDGGYILQLSAPGPDGALDAAYFNPAPIEVSRAEWMHQEGHLGAFVELHAPNYPGSTYTLAYDPTKDRLVGVYYQAAMGQRFDVAFERTP